MPKIKNVSYQTIESILPTYDPSNSVVPFVLVSPNCNHPVDEIKIKVAYKLYAAVNPPLIVAKNCNLLPNCYLFTIGNFKLDTAPASAANKYFAYKDLSDSEANTFAIRKSTLMGNFTFILGLVSPTDTAADTPAANVDLFGQFIYQFQYIEYE